MCYNISTETEPEEIMGHRFVFGASEKSGTGTLLHAERHEGCMELLFVRRGTVTVQTAMCCFSATEGELCFLAPDMVRIVTAEGPIGATVGSIYFDTEFLEDLPESIDRDLFYMFLMQSRTRENRYTPDAPLYDALVTTFETCYEEYVTRDLCYSLRIRAQIDYMMAQVIASYSTTRENDRVIYHNVLRLRDSLNYIDTHYREKMSVPTLAEYLRVTPDYYTKLFRDSIGKTTVDYINSVRINRGMILLLEADLPVSEVAEAVGLASGNYFSKLFRMTLGITPLLFRRENRP